MLTANAVINPSAQAATRRPDGGSSDARKRNGGRRGGAVAHELIVAAASNLIYREPGIPFSRYSDLDSGVIEANITPSLRDVVAGRLAGQFGQCGVMA